MCSTSVLVGVVALLPITEGVVDFYQVKCHCIHHCKLFGCTTVIADLLNGKIDSTRHTFALVLVWLAVVMTTQNGFTCGQATPGQVMFLWIY